MIELLVATITGLFGFLAAWVPKNNKSRLQTTQLEHRADSLALKIDLTKWSAINQEIRRLMDETCVDSFFILNAFNGYQDPQWATAVYQMQKDNNMITSYVDFNVDQHYVTTLKKIRNNGLEVIHAEDLPESLIKALYHTDGILASAWFHLEDKQLSDGGVALTYCTFSSRTCSDVDAIERCTIIANKIKSALR